MRIGYTGRNGTLHVQFLTVSGAVLVTDAQPCCEAPRRARRVEDELGIMTLRKTAFSSCRAGKIRMMWEFSTFSGI